MLWRLLRSLTLMGYLLTVRHREHWSITFYAETSSPPAFFKRSILNRGIIVAGMNFIFIRRKRIAHLVYKSNHGVMFESL